MEYLAFGLLGLGTIFIFIGILSAREKDKSDRSGHPPVRHQNAQPVENLTEEPRQQRPPFPTSTKLSSSEKIPYSSTTESALLFSGESTLYVDKSGNNLYDSSTKKPSVINTSAIHRIGKGNLTFNGFKFSFSTRKGTETLNLMDIEKVNFFSNCITFSKKNSATTLIFFIDNTKQIKALLDHHLISHVDQ